MTKFERFEIGNKMILKLNERKIKLIKKSLYIYD